MTLSPEDFRQRYEHALASEPPLPASVRDVAVATGRARIRRRRAASAVASVVFVATLGTTASVLAGTEPRDEEPAPSPTATDPTTLDTQAFPTGDVLLRLCREGEFQERGDAERFFESGTPTIKTVDDVGFQGSAMLESADGELYAWCRITPGHPEDSGMYVSRSADRDGEFVSYGGVMCEALLERGTSQKACSTVGMRSAARISPRVAAIELTMTSGEAIRIDVVDGYYVVEYLGPIPSGVKRRRDGDVPLFFQPVRITTYLDEQGRPLAQWNRDGVSTLPLLSRYKWRGTGPRGNR